MQFLRRLFDTSKKDVDALLPLVDAVNALEPDISALDAAALHAKGPEFRERMAKGETMEQLMPEVFAVVREASKRLISMRHFDVQIIGAAVLHQGRIAEMKTGEGKTLVAVGPMVLNALSGKGAHLVTVNDYLARRDAVWMGPVYDFMGLSVGIIQGQSADSDELGGSYRYVRGAPHDDPRYQDLVPCTRREAYVCDITYGTNHEFGFDYLRDNMAFEVGQLSMRQLNFAIIDEVDSILVDEARTPHIISGPSMEDVSVYKEVNVIVKQLEPEAHYVADKKNHSCSMTEEGMDKVEELLGIDNLASEPKLFHHVNASVKAYGLFDKDVDYVVRQGEVVIVDENTGRMMFGRRFSDGLHQALEAKEGVTVQRESQTVAVITFQNLFRLYDKLAGMTGTAKTEEDEFRKIYGLDVVCVPTNQPMIREDQADIVYKTLDAKFRGISWEILRLFTKQQPVLVGTRSIDMTEVTSNRLTSDMLQKLVQVVRLRDALEVSRTVPKEHRTDATNMMNTDLVEIKRPQLAEVMSKAGLPSDPLSDEAMAWCLNTFELPTENKEYLDEALRHGIPHNILNAKFHEREALIIAEAGRKGGVTIATNMAGRGVDILLGGRVSDELVERSRAAAGDREFEMKEDATSYRRGGDLRASPPLPVDNQERSRLAEEVVALGGLYILGTERHESRRIDNQLRGRSGRQGDPGESRFYVALEDQLWRIFNANMLQNPLLKAWPPMEEVNAKFLSGMIAKTQERIENHFFEARKHVLEYDDVLNAQREHIYGMRREILLGKDVGDDLRVQIGQTVAEIVAHAWTFDEDMANVFDHDKLFSELNEVFPMVDYATPDQLREIDPGPELVELCTAHALTAFERKVEEFGEVCKAIEQNVMLKAVNDNWMEHLQIVEYIREGIGLRGYGQMDPLIAYKRETYDTFQSTLKNIRDQAVRTIYHAKLQREERPEPQMMRIEDELPGAAAANTGPDNSAVSPILGSGGSGYLGDTDWSKVGRNEPCPCGSGKKFKACHYATLRAEGKI